MNYSLEVTIDKPIDEVIKLFDDPDNMKHWQEGFISFEPLSGTPGQEGARSRLIYKMGSREVEMIETIKVRNLPQEFTGTYEAKGVWNEVKNFFQPDGPGRTVWRSEVTFLGSGFMKLIMILMPGSFKKQSLKYMQDFKRFAEGPGY